MQGDSDDDNDVQFDPGTPADREALFEYLLEATMERDAFASLGDHPCFDEHPTGVDMRAEMEQYRSEVINADTDAKLWFALQKLSNARRDRHMAISEIESGLTLPQELTEDRKAPIEFAVDYGDPEQWRFFVGDRGAQLSEVSDGPAPSIGDLLVSINGLSPTEYVEAIRPYTRYSTEHAFWWTVASKLSSRVDMYYDQINHLDELDLAPNVMEELTLELRTPDEASYSVTIPYTDPDDIEWEGVGEPVYPGFSAQGHTDFDTYRDIYLPENDVSLVLLDWNGFKRDLPEAMDHLMDWAAEKDLLDSHVIVDATRSGGGSRGSYAVQRFQPEPHRGTFGNLKVSDAMAEWVEERIEGIESGEANPAVVDDGTWQREWLETDVQRAIEHDRYYTNAVPFKGAHAPKWADGIIEPADQHFRGGLTVWLSPYGGSHLDQFAAQVVDNDIGHIVGMPAGGYSSTWSWSETLRFPTTNRPIVTYRWSMGRSIRPNGETLQYNPAQPHEYVPQTRENYERYHEELLDRTIDRIGVSHPAR